MAETGDNTVRAALEAVVRDHGWLAASNPTRLRALLSDVLGAHADDHRGLLDAVVVSAEEGVPADMREAGPTGLDAVRSDMVGRLTSWGLTPDRAEWVVAAWASLVPRSTFDAPVLPQEPTTAGPTALPPSAGRPGPALVAAPGPTELPPEPDITVLPRLPRTTELPRRPETADGSDAKPRKRSRVIWPIAAVIAAIALTGGGIALARSGHQSKSPSDATSNGKAAADWTLVSAPSAKPTPARNLYAMAAKSGGVKISALGTVDEIGTGSSARVAPEGGRLVGFTLASFQCEIPPCTNRLSKLGLKVAEGSTLVPLPAGGPTYVLAVPAGRSADLVYAANGYVQRLSLLDGHADGQNITVLARASRQGTVAKKTFHLRESLAFSDVNPPGYQPDNSNLDCLRQGRDVTIASARLSYFYGHYAARAPLTNPNAAYVYIDVTYAQPACGYQGKAFEAQQLNFVPDSGPACERRYLRPTGNERGYFTVFKCAGNITGGKLVVGGSSAPTTLPLHNSSGSNGSETLVEQVQKSQPVAITFP